MRRLAKAIASVCGIGYINKGAGTVTSVATCFVWFLIPAFPTGIQLSLSLIVLSAGLWSSTVVEKIWGKDDNKIVIDEVAGMIIALIFIPVEIKFIVTALILFRFFDILKPLGIKKLELLPFGWGVMADDVVAGIYSLAIIKIAIILNLF